MDNLQINIPKGHIVDLEKSDLKLGVIHFKKVEEVMNYEDVAEKLFLNNKTYFVSAGTKEIERWDTSSDKYYINSGNSTSREQLESIMALNKLCNVAKYLNGDWVPNYNDDTEKKWSIYYSYGSFKFDYFCHREYSSVLFRSEKLANKL